MLNQYQNTMKALTFIIGIFSWLIGLCINMTVLIIGLVVYHWIWRQILIAYPNQQFHDWFRVMIFIGCMLICSWVINKMDEKPTLKVRITKTEQNEALEN
jgi:hypothetical protein